jgi:hypothetical protein
MVLFAIIIVVFALIIWGALASKESEQKEEI